MDMAQSQYEAALAAVERADAAPQDKLQMLLQLAQGMERSARGPAEYALADRLYDQALQWCRRPLDQARVEVARAAAMSLNPAADTAVLEQARDRLQAALPALTDGSAEEQAAAQMSLGLILQSLAAAHRAPIQAAITAYQSALRVFGAATHPLEFALLHNNLATAYLSLGPGQPGARMAEAMAVQAFEAALGQLDPEAHPGEYAMLQNNLGNALQYAASGHPLENNLRALKAYEEALRIRNERDAPVEYANTMANLGNCLANLPAEAVDFDPRIRAGEAMAVAERLFRLHGQQDKAELVARNRQEHGL